MIIEKLIVKLKLLILIQEQLLLLGLLTKTRLNEQIKVFLLGYFLLLKKKMLQLF